MPQSSFRHAACGAVEGSSCCGSEQLLRPSALTGVVPFCSPVVDGAVSNDEAWRHGRLLRVGSDIYFVDRNPPTVEKVTPIFIICYLYNACHLGTGQ